MAAEPRLATPDDVPDVLRMIEEWYAEDAEPAPTMDAAKVREDIFGEAPRAWLFVLEDGELLCGYALVLRTYEMDMAGDGYYMQDLYVRKNHRGGGSGKKLLKFVAKWVVDQGGRYFNWASLLTPSTLAFYRSLGGEKEEEATVFITYKDDHLRKLAEG